jgi:hypothetical protein
MDARGALPAVPCSDGAGNLRILCAGGYCARDDEEVDEEVEVKFGDPEGSIMIAPLPPSHTSTRIDARARVGVEPTQLYSRCRPSPG